MTATQESYEVSTKLIPTYEDPPSNVVSLEEFDQLVLNRLQVLKFIELQTDSGKREEEI